MMKIFTGAKNAKLPGFALVSVLKRSEEVISYESYR